MARPRNRTRSPQTDATDSPATEDGVTNGGTTENASAAVEEPGPVVPQGVVAAELAELEKLRELAAELTELLEKVASREKKLDQLSLVSNAELMVLLTALGPLRSMSKPTLPEPSGIDEYVEDMIDPEFGLRPARRIITKAAEHILHGYPALQFPGLKPHCGPTDDSDGQ